MSTLADLITTIDDMSDEQLRQHVHDVRHRRETIRPSAKKYKEKAIKVKKTKESRKKLSKVDKVFENLSLEEISALLGDLQKE